MTQDEQYLKLLVIFYYIGAALLGIVGFFPIIHLMVGLGIMGSGFGTVGGGEAALFGGFFVVVALFIMGFTWGMAACLFLAGRYITERRKHTFCIVVAALVCLYAPVGTLLGVFTIVLLIKEEIKVTFSS